MATKKSVATMNKTNQGIITDTIDRVLQENPDLTMPEFLGKMMDNNISFTIESFRGQHNAAMRYRVNGETGNASNISDNVTIGGLQKRGVTYQSSLHKEDMVLLAQRSMKQGVGDRPVLPPTDRATVADVKKPIVEETAVLPQPDQQPIPDNDSEYADQVYSDFAAVADNQEEPDYADQVFSDLATVLEVGLEPISPEEEEEVIVGAVDQGQKGEEEKVEPEVIEGDKEAEPEPVVTNQEKDKEEEPVVSEWDKEEEEEQKLVVGQGKEEEEPEEIVAEKAEATLQQKKPATVEQSAIDTVNFMLDLLQTDKFHPTSKIAEADRYSFSRSEEGGVQINDTYNKGRVVFQTDKDNNVKVSDFQPDEKAKFTALFTKLQKDEKKLRNIRSNLKPNDKLQATNQDNPKPEQLVAAEILQPPAKTNVVAAYEPIQPTADRLRDWTKDAYLTIKDPQERQETVSMLGGYLDKINNSKKYPGIVLSEEDFQTVSTLERNSYDLRSTRDGVVTRDQAILDNPQVRAELALVNQPKPQVQRPVPAQSQR
jgi:hypothetical protein